MPKPDSFYPIVLYSKDVEAVYTALATAGYDALAERIASLANPSESDLKLAASLPYLDDNEFDVDNQPIVSSSETGGYVMVWCWVSNEDAGIMYDDPDEPKVVAPITYDI